jgi:hypothetical protein
VDNYEQLQQHEQAAHQVDQAPQEAESETAPAQRLASNVGNQAFAALARQGAGIMPDGRAHPDVEHTIAQTRGGGQALDSSTRHTVGGALGDPLNDVRVHTDDTADRLANSVAARAFTTGSDVYFAKGEYQPGSSEGNRLLAHELSHVVQQRGAPTEGPLTVSQPGDALEHEADQASSGIYG